MQAVCVYTPVAVPLKELREILQGFEPVWNTDPGFLNAIVTRGDAVVWVDGRTESDPSLVGELEEEVTALLGCSPQGFIGMDVRRTDASHDLAMKLAAAFVAKWGGVVCDD